MVELQEDAHFPTFRDVLLFAAAVGFRHDRRVPFTTGVGDAIRYDTLTAPPFSEALINMIAANVVPDDPEVMDSTRVEERINIFGEYANGGLEYIQEQVNVRHQPAALAIIDLVAEAFTTDGGAKPASVDELLDGVSWR
ncbi:dnd system-associated protein 4 [Jiangella alkaliphila]|uniref:Dnd system-associated protein 4 n=2 Tax=Jiangella alkaliphila TaxID=419479 RepID=A0A1H2IWQ5_9ACTN|nr:dnd system-associated protein 4 [Jiangella alkaliphila]